MSWLGTLYSVLEEGFRGNWGGDGLDKVFHRPRLCSGGWARTAVRDQPAKVKSVGQECPTHTGISDPHERATDTIKIPTLIASCGESGVIRDYCLGFSSLFAGAFAGIAAFGFQKSGSAFTHSSGG